MTDSILDSVKEALGIEPDDTSFDNELIIHINSVFMIFNQLGVGPEKTFQITGDAETWSDFTPDDQDIPAVKSDMYYRVKLMFDSSTMSSGLVSEFNNKISELEWRLNIAADNGG